MTLADPFAQYMENHFRTVEGGDGVRNLSNLCQVLDYGTGQFSSDPIREFLADCPDAVRALVAFIDQHTQRNPDWQAAIEDAVSEEE